MDTIIEFPRPYLSRKILSEKTKIDKRLNDELRRIKLLLPAQFQNEQINSNIKNPMNHLNDSSVTSKTEMNSNLLNKKNIEVTNKSELEKKTTISNNKTVAINTAKTLSVSSSDTLTNEPSGNLTIGYNCTIDFISTLDFKPISGSFSTTKWYIVFEKNGGQYFIEEAYEIGQYTLEKPFLKSLIKCKWTMDFNLYAGTTYPTTKFKVLVEEYNNTTKSDVLLSDTVTVNFSGQNCIRISSIGLRASHTDGGYPSIKGGDHGTEPTIYVNLDAPAPPDGQTIYLEITGVSDVEPAAWVNASEVKIEAGQTYGEWTGIVGSRSVLTKKDVHVKVKISGPYGDSIGVSTLRITRK